MYTISNMNDHLSVMTSSNGAIIALTFIAGAIVFFTGGRLLFIIALTLLSLYGSVKFELLNVIPVWALYGLALAALLGVFESLLGIVATREAIPNFYANIATTFLGGVAWLISLPFVKTWSALTYIGAWMIGKPRS